MQSLSGNWIIASLSTSLPAGGWETLGVPLQLLYVSFVYGMNRWESRDSADLDLIMGI